MGSRDEPTVVHYREFAPHETLREDVRCFWAMQVEYPEGGTQEVVPDGCVELIFNFGRPYLPLSDPTVTSVPIASVVGFQDRTVRFRVSGTVKVVAARMQAWAALTLLQDRVDTLARTVRGLGPEWNELVGRIGERVAKEAYEEGVRTLEEFLIERALVRRYDRQVIEAAAKLLHQTKGDYRIAELADSCRMSMRQLERGFKSVVGTSPKNFARTLRFERAQRRLMFEPDADLTSLAMECGYFDQAHFIKDFKAFSGSTPSQYAREMRRMQRVLRAKDVVFLQSRVSRPG